MTVIVFANPKGGAGKTTCALVLATQLSESGATVTVVDADPERWISAWANLPGKPDNITIVNDVAEDSVMDRIEAATRESQFVIVDCEGTASLMVANAVGMADLVLVPTQGSSMDARGAAKTIRLIANQARLARREIQHRVVLCRTSAAVASRSLRNVHEQLRQAGIRVLSTGLVERAAYRDLFAFGGTLAGLDRDQVSNVDRAVQNAREFAGEVIITLKEGAS